MPQSSNPNHGPFTFMSDHERGIVGAVIEAMSREYCPSGDLLELVINEEDYAKAQQRVPDITTNYNYKTKRTAMEVRW